LYVCLYVRAGLWLCFYQRPRRVGRLARRLFVSTLWFHETTVQKSTERIREQQPSKTSRQEGMVTYERTEHDYYLIDAVKLLAKRKPASTTIRDPMALLSARTGAGFIGSFVSALVLFTPLLSRCLFVCLFCPGWLFWIRNCCFCVWVTHGRSPRTCRSSSGRVTRH
jgi:hypothetical protein